LLPFTCCAIIVVPPLGKKKDYHSALINKYRE
jgi:hypothetical protein